MPLARASQYDARGAQNALDEGDKEVAHLNDRDEPTSTRLLRCYHRGHNRHANQRQRHHDRAIHVHHGELHHYHHAMIPDRHADADLVIAAGGVAVAYLH